MGNKRNRRSRRLETPSPEREVNNTQLETPNTGNETLTNLNENVQGNLGDNVPENQLAEPSQTSNEIQVWTQILEQKSNDRITKMREEMDNKLESILKEIRSNKSMSTTTNPRSEAAEVHNSQPSGSKSIGVHASNFENTDSENEDYPLKASGSKDLKHPARPLYRNEIDLDETMISNEDSEEEDYHMIELNLIMTRQFLFSEKSRTNLTLEIKWESVNKRGRKSTVQTYSYVISCVEF